MMSYQPYLPFIMYHSGCSCIACIIAVVCKRGPLVHPTAHHIFYPATERRNRGVVFLPLASRHSRDHRPIASSTATYDDWSFESWRPRGARVPPAESTTRVRGPAAGGGNNGVVPQRTPRRGETTTIGHRSPHSPAGEVGHARFPVLGEGRHARRSR